MKLVRLNGAVSHLPGGTLSCPPPFFESFEIAQTALSKASVLTVTPSPTAPKSVRLKETGLSRGNSPASAEEVVVVVVVAVHQKTEERLPLTRQREAPPLPRDCQMNKEAKAAIQKTVTRDLWDERKRLLVIGSGSTILLLWEIRRRTLEKKVQIFDKVQILLGEMLL